MAIISMRRLGLVILSAVLLIGVLAWRLQASELARATFDYSSFFDSPIPSPTPTETEQATRTPTATLTGQPSVTPTTTPTPTETEQTTRTPTATLTGQPSVTPTVTPTSTATRTPTRTPTDTPVPPPIVILITPDCGDSSTPTHVVIYGAYFREPPGVTIGTTPLGQVRRVNQTEIEGDVPAGLAPGAYTISVCNPDAQCGRLENAFTVTGSEPILTGIVPSQGRNSAPNEVTVYGANLRPGIAITVGVTALVDTVWISDREVRDIVPAGLPSGVHDVTASNPGVPGFAVLPGGYTVLDASSDDFFVEDADVWTDPVTLHQGVTSAVILGANIHRQGGTVAKAVQVSFYLGDPAAGGVLLGTEDTVPMPPETGAVEPVFISWDPGDRVGAVTIYAQVDPAGLVAEANEANNLARRYLIILPPVADITPPSIIKFGVNEGAQSTTDPALRVAIKATDDSSGVYTMYLVEQVYNATANMWLAVQHTGWIPFQGAYLFTLTGPGGARYIKVWVADGAGNVTPLPSQARINYLPPSDTVLEGQVRVFRFAVASGERLAATLATLNAEGDADLYVWGPYHPDRRDLWMSDNAGMTVDEVSIVAPEAGEYDVEVRGWNVRSDYRLTVELDGAAPALRHATAPRRWSATAKPVPSRPADAQASAPAVRAGVPPAPISPPEKIYLPLILVKYQSFPPPPTYGIYLPLVLRNP